MFSLKILNEYRFEILKLYEKFEHFLESRKFYSKSAQIRSIEIINIKVL